MCQWRRVALCWRRKTLPQLGQPSVKVEQLDTRANDDIESLKAAAAEERARREASGIGDSVQNRQPVQPPPFDVALVGRHLEVRTKLDVLDPVTRQATNRRQATPPLSGGPVRCWR